MTVTDLTIVTFGNGVRMSLRVAQRIRTPRHPQPGPRPAVAGAAAHQDILREATATGRVLVVDETRRTGGVGQGVLAALIDERLHAAEVRRVASRDSFIPLGDAARQVLLTEDTIEAAAIALVREAR